MSETPGTPPLEGDEHEPERTAADVEVEPADTAAGPADAPAPAAGPRPAADARAAVDTQTGRVTDADEPTAANVTGVGKDRAREAAKADDRREHRGGRQPAARTQRAGRRDATPGVVVQAHAKYVRTSARKARLVCDHIRGKSVTEARAILAHTPRAVARDWAKLLESAVANAEHNHELVGDELRVLAVTADEGPTIKRFRPRAMGRASKINKRTAHLSIQLTAKETR
jgi:ribosomal protein L22